MKRSIVIACIAAALCCGCVVTLKDQGEVSAFFGTAIGIRTTSSATQAQSEARLNSQPLEDWLRRQNSNVDTAGVAQAKTAPVDTNGVSAFDAFRPATPQ